MPNVGFRGEQPASAMACTVGIPAALAALFIADGTIHAGAGAAAAAAERFMGVQSPFVPGVYDPILDGLAKVGIRFTELTRVVQQAAGFLFLVHVCSRPFVILVDTKAGVEQMALG